MLLTHGCIPESHASYTNFCELCLRSNQAARFLPISCMACNWRRQQPLLAKRMSSHPSLVSSLDIFAPEVMPTQSFLGGVPAAVVGGYELQPAGGQGLLQGRLVGLARQGGAHHMRRRHLEISIKAAATAASAQHPPKSKCCRSPRCILWLKRTRMTPLVQS